jgi:hypothetical protein
MQSVIILNVVAAEQQPTNFDNNQKNILWPIVKKRKKIEINIF